MVAALACDGSESMRLEGTLAAAVSAASVAPPGAPAPPRPPVRASWIALGGGAEPLSNQVSIEQDLSLARTVLGPEGWMLFAGGPGRSPVQELDASRAGHRRGLAQRLGALFDPRDGRAARYRGTTLAPHGAATLEPLEQAWATPGQGPLLLVVAGHGEQGRSRDENLVRLWGGDALTVRDLDELTAASPRPSRLVMGTCFSGGFAELAFSGAAPPTPTSVDRCGLFASTWDREASGCDPNPDRRTQESYLLHMFMALAGKDRDGAPLRDLDLDGDGQVSLLEAHTRARIAQRSFGVPTTTSERLLEVAVGIPDDAGEPPSPSDWPEEVAVVRELGRIIGSASSDLAAELERLAERRRALEDEAMGLQARSEEAWFALRIALLERWPVLDDPYHPDYARTLAEQGLAIAAFLARDARAAAFDETEARLGATARALDEVERGASRLHRWARARDNLRRAAMLRSRGGAAWEAFQRVRRCERYVPRRRLRGGAGGGRSRDVP